MSASNAKRTSHEDDESSASHYKIQARLPEDEELSSPETFTRRRLSLRSVGAGPQRKNLLLHQSEGSPYGLEF